MSSPTATPELELDADGLAKVPTCVELGRIGLARERTHMVRKRDGSKGEETRWEVDAAGFERIRVAMKHNAEVLQNNPQLRRRLEAESFRR